MMMSTFIAHDTFNPLSHCHDITYATISVHSSRSVRCRRNGFGHSSYPQQPHQNKSALTTAKCSDSQAWYETNSVLTCASLVSVWHYTGNQLLSEGLSAQCHARLHLTSPSFATLCPGVPSGCCIDCQWFRGWQHLLTYIFSIMH